MVCLSSRGAIGFRVLYTYIRTTPMKRILVFYTLIIGVFVFARGQGLPPTTCLETIIEIPHQSWNGVIPQCLDTIRVGFTSPMPPTGLMLPGTCASLFEVQGRGQKKDYRLIPSKVVCENVERILVIPSERLEPELDPGKMRTYEIHTYCEYWRGKTNTDTTVIPFQVSRGFRAHARAIDFETGLEIAESGMVEPTEEQAANTGNSPFRLNAWSSSRYEFMFWTCTHTTIEYDIYAPFQEITTRCWPINVTTVFNAFFRPRTTTVYESAESSVSLRHAGSTITIERPKAQDGEITVMTAMGRIAVKREWKGAMEEISLTGLAPGVYVCVIRDADHTTHTLINYH